LGNLQYSDLIAVGDIEARKSVDYFISSYNCYHSALIEQSGVYTLRLGTTQILHVSIESSMRYDGYSKPIRSLRV